MSQGNSSLPGLRRIGAIAIVIMVLFGLAPISAHGGVSLADVGKWSAAFMEGGIKSAQCSPIGSTDKVICKPTAVSIAPLANGSVLYWNGIEGSENIHYATPPQAGNEARDSQARVLTFRSPPKWLNPFPMRGPSGNAATGADDLPPDQALMGELGVPGRPGDGFVGSTIGQVYSAPPVAPPNDPAPNDSDMFCSDLVQLVDGRLLIAGGTDFYSEPGLPYDVPTIGGWGVPELEGLRNTRIYDPKTNRFSKVGAMKYGRWYPTLVTLPNGDVFVASGVTKLVKSTQGSQVRRTETFSLKTMKWKENFVGMASENSLPLYARLHLMPNGKIFYAGGGQMNGFGPTGWAVDEAMYAMQQFFDPKTSTWEMVGPATLGVRGGAFSVMLPMKPPYDVGQLLVGGGTALLPTPGTHVATPFTEIVSVDKTGNVSSELTGMLNNPRWFSTAVVLPDGKVAAFNGANSDEVAAPGTEISVKEAELFDPATGEWSSIGEATRIRTYHNSAVLLADGRVLVGGHSPIPFMNYVHMSPLLTNNDKDASFELYSPPYLFRGARPTIAYAPKGIAWNKSFKVTMGNADKIESVVLSRLGAQTHTVDSDQRTLFLKFSQSGKNITVKAPPTGVTAPPGPYYLFVNRKTAKGPVPSVAAIMRVGRADAAPAVKPMGPTTLAGLAGTAADEAAALTGKESGRTHHEALAPAPGGDQAAPLQGEQLASSSRANVARVPVGLVIAAAFGGVLFLGRRRRGRKAPPLMQ